MLHTFFNKLQSFLCLLHIVILCVLVEAVYKLNEILFNQAKILANHLFESFERLHHKMFLCILGCQGENVDHNTPSRFEILCLRLAHVCYCHYDKLFYFKSCVQIMQHYSFKRLQEVFLEVIVAKFFFEKEFIS